MVIGSSIADAKVAWLKAARASSYLNIEDLEYDFYSNNSGLTPKSKYSLADHKLAFLKTATTTTTPISLTDVEMKYFRSKGAVGPSYDDVCLDNYKNRPYYSTAGLYDTAVYDTAVYG